MGSWVGFFTSVVCGWYLLTIAEQSSILNVAGVIDLHIGKSLMTCSASESI